MAKEKEIWKAIPEYEGVYEASSLGRIRRFGKRRTLEMGGNTNYAQAMLCKKGTRRHIWVHTIIAKTFLGECPEGYEVNHINLNKRDNRIDNLEYVTRLENMQHAAINHARKDRIDNELARKIRKMALVDGCTYKELSKLFNLTTGNIEGICKKKSVSYAMNEHNERKLRKVSEKDAKGILLLKEQGYLKQRDMADIYDVHESVISMIVRGIYKGRYSKGKQ